MRRSAGSARRRGRSRTRASSTAPSCAREAPLLASRWSRSASSRARTRSTSCCSASGARWRGRDRRGRRLGRYDALADPELARELVELMRRQADVAGGEAMIEFRAVGAAAPARPRERAGRWARAVEHVGRLRRRADPEGYRRLEAGINPELELLRFLTERGFPNIAALAGWYAYRGRPMDATLGDRPALRRRRRRRLGARARRAAARPRGVPRPPAPARRGDGRDAHACSPPTRATRLRSRGAERRGARAADGDDRRGDRASLPRRCPTTPTLEPIAGRGEEVRERLRGLSHVGHVGKRDPHARRLPPRPGALGRRTTGWSSTSRASRRARSPSGGASARRCATSPGCCARSPTRVGAESCAASRSEAGRSGARGVPRRLPRTSSAPAPAGRTRRRAARVFELEKAVYELRYELNNRPDWVRSRGGIRAARGAASARRRSSASARDPHCLGAHPPNGGVVRAFRPDASGARRRPAVELERRTPAVRGCVGARCRSLRLEVATRTATRSRARSVRVPADARRARPPPRRRGPARAALRRLGAHVREATASSARLRGLGAERARGQRRRRLQRLGRPAAPDALARRVRDLGALRAGRRAGQRYKFEIAQADGKLQLKADPFAFATEVPPHDGVGRLPARVRVGRRRVDRRAGAPRSRYAGPMSIYEVHLGSWRRNPLEGNRSLTLPRARRRAGRLRGRPGLHARRAAAGDGAPVRGLVGLPGDGLLRADLALRPPGRLPRVRRPAAPARARRDPRLGAGALPARRLGARALRRHRALRARRPAPRRAPRLGHARLQLSAATRCGTSCSRTRSSGCASSTSTGCASTPSPRCSTSTTRARRASGCRTSSAAARTSTRSRS